MPPERRHDPRPLQLEAARSRAGAGLRLLSAAVALAAVACSDEPEDLFDDVALPVLEHRCLTPVCHGVGPGEAMPEAGYFVRLGSNGRVADRAEARRASLTRVVTTAPATLSTLVREPMPSSRGGGPHAGGEVFQGPDDPALRALVRWIDSEPDGSGGEDVDLTPLELQFGETVLPPLVERCGRAGCHGPSDIANTALPARPDPASGLFSPVDIAHSYEVVRKHIDRWSDDPTRSRIVRKALGPAGGGMAHRGGPDTFFPEADPARPLDAPGLQALLAWIAAERAAVEIEDGRAPAGIVWVRGPLAERAPFRIETGRVGSDLFFTPWPVREGREENLTATLHPRGPAEIRDPAVSHDGRRIAFAMRLERDESFALWELDLASREARRIRVAGLSGSAVQPAYAPDGRLIVVSDGHGEAGVDGPGTPPELFAIDPDEQRVQRLTFTPAPEVMPSFIASGKPRGGLLFATRRTGPSGSEGVLFRFPLCHDPAHHGEPEYHVHFGASIAPEVPFAARDLPDGRQVMTVLASAAARDDRGTLALLDRSLGPALAPDRIGEASTGGFLPPLVRLDDQPRWRDPAPLPDGRVLVARDSLEAPGDDAIVLVDPDGGELSARDASPIIDAPGLSDRSPVVVIARVPEDDHPPIVDPALEHGRLVLRDVAVLEAIFGRAAPHGRRPLREDIAALRLLAWAGAPADVMRDFDDGGTAVGLTRRPPARVLGEIPLPEDRSAFLEVPSRQPILLQLIDARGMTVGSQLERWYYAEGGELVPGGTNAPTYAHSCSGCHGSLSGDPAEAAAPPPDVLASASVTLATYEQRDRRRPLAPLEVTGEAMAIDYASVVGPLLARRCTGGQCHGGSDPAAGLALDDTRIGARFPAAYEALLARSSSDGPGLWVDLDGGRARTSVLVERLLGEELDAPRLVTGRCPPDGLDASEVRTIVQWIESGAAYDVAAGVGR